MTDRLFPSLLIAQKIKESPPNIIKIMLGGAHVNSVRDEVMTDIPLAKYIDACFVGESEDSIVRYVSGEAPGSVPGLIYRDESGKIKAVPHVIPVADLDDLPFPDLRDIRNVSAYYTPYFNRGPMTTMMATRGCPFSCKFCDVHTNMGRSYRTRSPENLINEIIYQKKTSSVNNFYFKDSIFNLHKRNTIEFCELLLKHRLKISWICNSRVDSLDPEMAALMSRSGCKVINFGVESLDPSVLKWMNKKNRLDDVRKTFEICRSVNIATTAYMMVGSEGETYENYMNGFKELLKLKPTLAVFSVTTAYPGTELYREALQKDLLKDAKWYYNVESTEGGHLALPAFSIEEQKKASKESYRMFFFRISKIAELLCRFFSFQFLVSGTKFVFRIKRQFQL